MKLRLRNEMQRMTRSKPLTAEQTAIVFYRHTDTCMHMYGKYSAFIFWDLRANEQAGEINTA